MISKNLKKIITFILIFTVLFINNSTVFAYDLWDFYKENTNTKTSEEVEKELKKKREQIEKYEQEQEKKLEEKIKSFEKDILNDKKMEEEQKKLEEQKKKLDQETKKQKVIIDNKTAENIESSSAYKNLDLIDRIKKGSNNETFTINIDEYPLLYKDVFKALQSTTKQLVLLKKNHQIIYKGENINNPKTIDLKFEVTNNINEITEQYIKTGITINFSNNGELPGTAIIKIKAEDELKNILGTQNIYLYQYDIIYNKLKLKQDNISLIDNYYEFEISNGQTYVLSSEVNMAPKNNDVIENEPNEDEKTKLNDKQKEMLIVLGSPILLILLATLVLYITKRQNEKYKYE